MEILIVLPLAVLLVVLLYFVFRSPERTLRASPGSEVVMLERVRDAVDNIVKSIYRHPEDWKVAGESQPKHKSGLTYFATSAYFLSPEIRLNGLEKASVERAIEWHVARTLLPPIAPPSACSPCCPPVGGTATWTFSRSRDCPYPDCECLECEKARATLAKGKTAYTFGSTRSSYTSSAKSKGKKK